MTPRGGRTPINLFCRAFLALAILSGCGLEWAGAGERGIAEGIGDMAGFLGEGIDFKGGMLDWEEDDNGHRVAILRNYAVVILPQLTISARNMVLNIEMQEIYAEGDVLFNEPGGNSFHCDQLTFNYQEWQGLAKNIRVKMDRADVVLPVRDFLDDQPATTGADTISLNDAGNDSKVLKRMYVQAQELRAHDDRTFELIDAKITPDAFAKPHWYFRSPGAILRRKEKIESYHNTVNIGRFPVLYFPYLIRDLQYDWPWMRISGGHTGDYGYFVRTQWGWRLQERPNAYLQMHKIIFDLDWFSRRGVGVGAETTYKMGHLDSAGKLKLYGVYEYGISDWRDMERALEKNQTKIYQGYPGFRPDLYQDDFRWAVEWEHYQQLNDLWDIRAEANLYHDRDYLKDYDPTKYWTGKEPENSIDLRRLDKQWELEFVASSRLSNKWQTSSDYYPEARLTVPGLQLGNLPLFLKNDFRLGFVNRGFDEDQYQYTNFSNFPPYGPGFASGAPYPADGLFARDPVTGFSTSRLVDSDRYGTIFRAFNEARLEAPIQLFNMFTLKPWVGLRLGYYSDTLGTAMTDAQLQALPVGDPLRVAYENGMFAPGMRTAKGSGEYNYAVPFGVDFSTRTYTIFGAHDQWRLITEPVVSYLENTKPRLDYKRDLYPIDFYDDYTRQRRVGFELHNKLQRRYYENAPGSSVPERDILDFNLAFYYYPRKGDRMEVNNNTFSFSEMNAEVVFRPTRHLSLSLSADYDTHDGTLNRAIAAADWRLGSLFRIYAAHYYYRGNYWRYPESEPSSQTHLAIRTKLWNDSSHYSLEGAVAYEWRSSTDWQTSRDGVRHGFNKYRVTLFRDLDTFELALSYVRDRNADNQGVYFSLSPKSFMGFDRPPPTYSAAVETMSEGRYPESVRYLGSGYAIDGPAADADLKDVQF